MAHTPSDVADEESPALELPSREYFRLLAAERRRRTLEALAETADPVDLEELAADVVRDEADDALERVTLELHHAHLPMMAELGVLDYDPETHRVDPTGVSIDDIAPRHADR